jgi:hypothetical protein
MHYRLWDTDIGHLFGRFETEQEALAFVATLVASYGRGYADDLSLNWEDASGAFGEPLSGAALLARVDEVVPTLEQGGSRRSTGNARPVAASPARGRS